jgi:putative addiction module killer protein
MNTIVPTAAFDRWLKELNDDRAKARIATRIGRAMQGNFGDAESVGNGISEMRIDVGAGYRVYFAREGRTFYILLCDGSKKTQPSDIRTATRIWEQIQKGKK